MNPTLPIELDSPFQARYDSNTGVLTIRIPVAEIAGGNGQLDTELHISASALLRLRDMVEDLEQNAGRPPSTHETTKQEQ